MARLDVRDKDPFAHAEEEPKDNISFGGFFFRIVVRYMKIFILYLLHITAMKKDLVIFILDQ